MPGSVLTPMLNPHMDLKISREVAYQLHGLGCPTRDVMANLFSALSQRYFGGVETNSRELLDDAWKSYRGWADEKASIGGFCRILFQAEEERWRNLRESDRITYPQFFQNCIVLYRALVQYGLLPNEYMV